MLNKINSAIKKENLQEILEKVFEIIFLEEYQKPCDEDGHMEFNTEGKVFAINGAGGEYILLEDGSIGFNSHHGSMGRVAESFEEFLELIINCPYWEIFVEEEEYQSIERLDRFVKVKMDELIISMKEDNINLEYEQKRVASYLGIKLYEDIAEDVLTRLYVTAKRTPLYEGIYIEADGSKNHIVGCVFTKEF